MTTIVRQYAAPAAFPDTIVLDLEPTVTFPEGVLGAYRLAKSIGFSQAPRAGTWAALSESSGGTKTYAKNSVQLNDAMLAVLRQPYPAGAATGCIVFKQSAEVASGESKFLGGAINGSTVYGLIQNAAGMLALHFGNSPSSTPHAALPISGGDRWEMVFQRVNRVTGTVDIYRPRDNALASGTFNASSDPASAAMRAVGTTDPSSIDGPVEAAWAMWWGRELSEAEMNALYLSVKSSLAASQIEI